MLLGEIVLALDDIGFAEIFAHLRIVGIERDRFQVIADALVGVAELAGRVAAIVERARRVRVVQQVEHVDRFLISVGLGERVGVFGEFGIRQDAAAPDEALLMLRVPDHARRAGREVGLSSSCEPLLPPPPASRPRHAPPPPLRRRRRQLRAATSAAAAAAPTSSAAASAASATAAGGEDGRGQRETGDEQSTAERRDETAAFS